MNSPDQFQINLSQREREILELIAFEHTTAEIASLLYLSTETIKSHRRNLLHKLGVRNVAGMIRRAMEYNMVPLT